MEGHQFFNFSSLEFGSRIISSLKELQREKDFCDVTITSEGRKIEAHQAILSRGSIIFRNILKQNTQSHPLIILSGIKFPYLLNILDFMYQGEVRIDKKELGDFLAVARDLEVNNLTEEAFRESNQSIENTIKKQGLASSPKQSLNLDYKIKTDHIVDDFHSDDLKIDVFEDADQFSDADFDHLKEEQDGIPTKDNPIDISYKKDFYTDYEIKIELEMENKNAEEAIKISTSTQCPVNEERKGPAKRLQIRDISKLSENAKCQSISSKSDTFKNKFKCEQCNKSWSSKANLKIHVLGVHEKRKYACTKCDYEATTKSNLSAHILNVHEGIKYPCSQCDYTARFKSNLKTHILNVHEGKKYPCSQCEYKATAKYNLKAHILSVHEGINFPCSQCDRTFTTKQNLIIHILSVHEGKIYSCSQCEYKATSKSNLRTHVVKRHL